MIEIVQKSHPSLRSLSKDIDLKDVRSARVKQIIKDMKTALALQEDGVALAAPQIGVSLRIFIVSGKVFEMEKHDKDMKKALPDMVFINPKITRTSKGRMQMEEGCLSVRNYYGKTMRAAKVRVRAYDAEGKLFEHGGSGLLAQIFQHEIDHLNGIIFTDKATDVEYHDPKEQKK